VRRTAAVLYHLSGGFMQRMCRLEAAAQLLALLDDAAGDVGDRLRDGLAAAAQRLRRLVERLELRAHASHRLQQGRLQLIDVERRRELIGEAPDHRDVLDAVRGPLVMLQLEETDVAIAESH